MEKSLNLQTEEEVDAAVRDGSKAIVEAATKVAAGASAALHNAYSAMQEKARTWMASTPTPSEEQEHASVEEDAVKPTAEESKAWWFRRYNQYAPTEDTDEAAAAQEPDPAKPPVPSAPEKSPTPPGADASWWFAKPEGSSAVVENVDDTQSGPMELENECSESSQTPKKRKWFF